MQNLFVGMPVLYLPKHCDPTVDQFDDQPHAATVARVNFDGTVNLSVIDANGNGYSRWNVEFIAPGSTASSADGVCVLNHGFYGVTSEELKAEVTAPDRTSDTGGQELSLTTDQLGTLSTDQVAAISTEQVPALATEQFQALTTEQL